jgi:hypothetical protein
MLVTELVGISVTPWTCVGACFEYMSFTPAALTVDFRDFFPFVPKFLVYITVWPRSLPATSLTLQVYGLWSPILLGKGKAIPLQALTGP